MPAPEHRPVWKESTGIGMDVPERTWKIRVCGNLACGMLNQSDNPARCARCRQPTVQVEVRPAVVDDWQPRPGEMHPVDEAFYRLAIKERDFERVKCDRLEAENERLRALLAEAPGNATTPPGRGRDHRAGRAARLEGTDST